ncbi:MAG: vWA domain-containing protein [Deinococcus sp.]|uniref:vWA domain-containing protein n=1 Tax=Deinococcus sp. TaxID=47478 RepID=UPI0026DB4962|nr:vWA domain-containing protein [Deinococcus sp.]MDO4244739.1 vWA domain-containing protein [Deinococcus sp.]
MRHPNLTKTLTGRLLLVGGFSLLGLSAAQGTAPLTLTRPAPTSSNPFATITTCKLPSGPIPTQSRAVFVLDTSGSMRGIGDGKADIFNEVKGKVERYVDTARPDEVQIITFDSGVRAERNYSLPAQESQLRSDLRNLKADGNNTYLYRSMHAALSPLAASDRYVTSVFVLTDGIDNDPQPRYSAESALSSFQARGKLDTLAYVALGSTIPTDAKNALAASDYASGITLPPGEVPDLVELTGGIGMATVTDPSRVPAPFADGTPLALASQNEQVTLAQPAVVAGTTQLNIPKDLPAGSTALLCAPPPTEPNVVGPRTRRVLLKLRVGETPPATTTSTTTNTGTSTGTPTPTTPPATVTTRTTTTQTTTPAVSVDGAAYLTWLNPGADTRLGQGDETVLRYRASPDMNLDGSELLLPAGLQGFETVLERQSGARDFALRVRRTASSAPDATLAAALPSGLLTPRLLLSSGQVISLVPVQVGGLSTTAGRETTLPVSPIPAAPGTTQVTLAPGTQASGTQVTTSQTTTQTAPANGTGMNGTGATGTQGAGVQPNGTQPGAAQTATGQNNAAQTGAAQTNGTQGTDAQTSATQTTTQTTTTQTTPATERRSGFPWWLLLLPLLLLLGLLAFGLWRRRGAKAGTGSMAAAAVKGNRPPPAPKKVVAAAPVAVPAQVPAAAAPAPTRVEGVHYRDDRTLALIGLDGEVRGMPSPLSGPFDLGQVSRVAELRGLRAEQLHEGLQLVQIPEDLIVSHDTKLLSSGDLIAPGTLLSVIPAASNGTAARPSLGSLTGLGRPLMLRANGAHLEITGPYGDHLLNLTPGILDLGELLEAPALRGLRLSTRGYRILLTDVPAGLSVAPSGEHTPLKPGMYLPERIGLLLRGL